MPLRPLPFREVDRRLRAAGFEPVASRGSHFKYAKSDTARTLTVIVPHHAEVAIGTLRSILRQADLTPQQFDSL
jgi:predicted RNA binding protein YcfA (HicA-like mRNA interferase family)